MSACARFILVNYKQDLLGENTVDNTVDQKIALPFYVMLILHLVLHDIDWLNFWCTPCKIPKVNLDNFRVNFGRLPQYLGRLTQYSGHLS